MRNGLLACLALGVLVEVTAGCSPENRLNVVMEEGSAAPRPNLPAVPTLPPPPQPLQHPDGAYTIWGIRHVLTRQLNQEVRVRGYIVSVYEPMVPNARPPRRCREQDHCLEEKPHVYIADTANEQNRENWMQITNYANYQADIDNARIQARHARPTADAGADNAGPAGVPLDFYQGARIMVTGRLKRRSSNGQADSNGLLEYVRHATEERGTDDPQNPAARRH